MRRYHQEIDRLSRRAAALFSRRASAADFLWNAGKRRASKCRKHKAMDCGNTRCRICHGDKFPVRIPTRQEVLAKFSQEDY